MILSLHQINEQQLEQLNQLALICKKTDKSTPNLYTHILTQHRTYPACLLYYEKEVLVGFLSTFFFYEDAVEISLMIHPQYRHKGIAKNLLNLIAPLVESQSYDRVIVSSPAQLNSPWFKHKGLSYSHSEYYMERDYLNPVLEYNKRIKIRHATIDDAPMLHAIDEQCFPTKSSALMQRLEQLLGNRDYEVMIALFEGIVVGKAHIRWQANGATFSDIAILPAHQGNGLGTSLIAQCINYALSMGKPNLNLDVETHNTVALNLYTRLGFVMQNACEFWSFPLSVIIKPLNN
jgi:ribosomal protein S18 acetylase RimI-like enzyme